MGTELYIKPYGAGDYSLIDLQEGIPLPYTYNVLDIRNPDKRNGNWSKTLKIPGTKANNILFQNIFEIGIDDSYNANKKAEVYVLQDSLEVARGVMQLLKITRDKQNLDRIYYECALNGGIKDIFTALADDKLTDLDLSAYDHTYNATAQAASWSASIGVGYVYPMIDYSGRNRAVALSNYDAWNVDEFYPAIYVKQYIDKIFTYASKTYTSAFFGTDFFKKLIIPFNRERYQFTDADIIAREFRALSTSPTATAQCYPIVSSATATLDNDSTGTAYDPGNVFNITTYRFTVATGKSGYYTLEAGGDLGFMFVEATANLITATTGGSIRAFLFIEVYDSSNTLKASAPGTAFFQLPQTNDTFTSGSLYYENHVSVRLNKILLNEGDYVLLKIKTTFKDLVLDGSSTVHAHLDSGAYLQCFLINEITEGVGIAVNSCIPENIRMRDFLKSIVQMFHLYMQVDPDNTNNYLIEPRDAWYSTDVVDWSAKLDYEKGLEIVPMADLQGKLYSFKYKADKDYYNESYQKKFSFKDKPRTYGDKYIEVDNDFVSGEVANEIIFSPTPSVGNDFNTRIIPSMVTLNGSIPEHKATNIRILYYSGLKNYTGRAWVHYSKIPGTYTAQLTQYPYAGHLDDPFNPTLDLSFGMPKEVNWNIRRQNYTDGNLYNKYHKRFIEEITDPDSRMVTGYFLLTALDIFNLSFRKLYYFHNELYRLNKIIDYDLAEYKLVKCEFLKVKDPGVYSVSSLPIYGGGDSVWNGDIMPDVALPKLPHENNYGIITDAVVTGTANIVAPTVAGVVVIGTGNSVGDNARNIFIQGSSNIIYPGIQNVTLIQTDGVTVTEDNTTYINGCAVVGCVAVVPE